MPPETATPLHVVSHRHWLADELAATTLSVHVNASLGFDIPAGVADGDPFWAPMEWAARAEASCGPLRLVDPGPRWLLWLHERWLGRRVEVMSLRDLAHRVVSQPRVSAFCKPANFKHEHLPARVGAVKDFVSSAWNLAIPRDSLVLLSDVVDDFYAEHRCFVLDGRVVASSPYLVGGQTPDTYDRTPLSTDAEAFAAEVLADARHAGDDLPPTFVLDVATTDRGWVVVESNPAWASNPYGCDVDGVVACLLRARDASPTWCWRPDPYLATRASRLPALRIEEQVFAP